MRLYVCTYSVYYIFGGYIFGGAVRIENTCPVKF